ncbi:MAG TPA: 3-keto-5-aminohexanoate cleavage protein [Chloroflexota bacterium]|nr:3-keto-5-aminohexanoate cleavage protein [Chloroflexota bacterium]
MDKLIISVATTGTWPTKDKTPHVPVTPDEIIADAVACREAGAAIVHIHARDSRQRMTQDPETLERIVSGIRERSDILINLTTSGGVGEVAEEERFNPLRFAPDLASFDAGSVNFGERVFLNSPPFLAELARRMQEAGVKPEIECFDSGFITNAHRLADDKLLDRSLYFQFVLGVPGAAPATPRQLLHMIEQIPGDSTWSICAIGRHQLPMNVMAIAMGGHARTGLEDNIYYRRGELATNAGLVERLVRIAREVGREVATPAEARALLNLG